MHAVAEAARKVACTGATPVAATNCLNFGNPEKPEIMAQLSSAIDGIAEACIALGTPVTGGNVSLYNETKGVGIYPTPVLGIVGIIEDVTKSVPASFRKAGDAVLFLSAFQGQWTEGAAGYGRDGLCQERSGRIVGHASGAGSAGRGCTAQGTGCAWRRRACWLRLSDLSDGGCSVAFAKACFPRELGREHFDAA